MNTRGNRSRLSTAASIVGVSLVCADLFAILASGKWSFSGLEVGAIGVVVRLGLLAVALIWYRRRSGGDAYTLVLGLALLTSLYQFHVITNRRVGDGFFYYAYAHSLLKDFDLRFDNQYRQYGIADLPYLIQPTVTGRYSNTFPVGAAIFWAPFFLLGEGVGRVLVAVGRSVNLAGSGPVHWNAVSLGSVAYGFAGVLLVQSLLRRYFAAPFAFAGAALIWLASSHHWYMVYQPQMSHAVAMFASALFIWLWDRDRLRIDTGNGFRMGVVGGLAACVRWQSAILWLLPFIDWMLAVRARRWHAVRWGVVFLGGVFLGILPQLVAWKLLYGQFLLLYAPHGADFVRWSEPPVTWEMFFSSRHGLLTWTPVIWLGLLGYLPLLSRRKLVFWSMGLAFVLMTYVNGSVLDWWGSGSYSGRRFDAMLPIFAFGVSWCCAWTYRLVVRRPGWITAALLAFFVLWNALFMEQYHRYRISPDETVAFADVAAGNAEIFLDTVGYPFAWPVNWIHAWSNDLTFRQSDLLYGRYLFSFRVGATAAIDVGQEDGALMGEDWSEPAIRAERWVRVTRRRRADLFFPLERSSDIELVFTMAVRPGPAQVAVEVNGKEAGRFLVTPGFHDYALRVTGPFWKAGVNRVTLRRDALQEPQLLLLDRIQASR